MANENEELAGKLDGASDAQMSRLWAGATSKQRDAIKDATGYTGPEAAPISPGKKLRRKRRANDAQQETQTDT